MTSNLGYWDAVLTKRGLRFRSPSGALHLPPIVGGDEGEPSSTAVMDRLAAVLERLEGASAGPSEEEISRRIADGIAAAVAAAAGGEPETPSRREEPTGFSVGFNEIEQHWADADPELEKLPVAARNARLRSLYELSMMIFGGTWRMSQPTKLYPPDELVRGWQHHVFETGSPPIIADGSGNPIKDRGIVRHLTPQSMLMATERDSSGRYLRAMDSAETGYGLELIGAQYVRDLWAAARNMDSLVGDIRTIPMTDPTTYIPIDGDLPEMLFVGENTSASASAYTTSKTASSRRTLTAKKFTIQQVWSAELDEDSIIAFTPFLREKLAMSAAMHLGSAYYNGDDTNAGTGNINTDDADPTDTKHYLAWDGIRHYWIVDATGQGKSMAATLDPHEIDVARGKLNGGDDDVDNAIKNINWGLNARDLRLVADWDTYMAMLDIDDVRTVDKYGPQATVLTGELASYRGIPIISPAYASKTEADFKASTTEASNTKGQITVFAPAGWIGGVRREVQLFFDRIQRTDQFLFELYTRRAFTRFGGNVAAGIGNITL